MIDHVLRYKYMSTDKEFRHVYSATKSSLARKSAARLREAVETKNCVVIFDGHPSEEPQVTDSVRTIEHIA